MYVDFSDRGVESIMSHLAVANLYSRTRVVTVMYSETVCSFSIIKMFMVMAKLPSVAPETYISAVPRQYRSV
jgi:hypothetical protein